MSISHTFSYIRSETLTVGPLFRVTQRESAAKETWRAFDAAGVEELKKSSVSGWSFDGGELVKNGYGITKVRGSM